MPIRIKILIILLLTTVPPILFLRATSMQSMNKLAENVETRTEAILLNNINRSLLRIVEDHARLLKRETQLIDAALGILARDASIALASQSQSAKNTLSKKRKAPLVRGLGYREDMVDSSGLCMYSPSPKTKDNFKLLLPTVEKFANRYPDLILWQQIRLLDNSQLFLPTKKVAASVEQCLFGELAPPSIKEGTSWSQPIHDPLFKNSIFTATRNVYSKGIKIGVVTIAVPIRTLLRDPGHLSKISPNVKSYLVSTNAEGDGLVIFAVRTQEEQDGRWFTSPKNKLELDKESIRQISGNIVHEKASLLSATVNDENLLIAYAPLGIGEVTLLITVPRIDIVDDASKETDVIRAIFSKQMDTSHLLLSGTLLLLGIIAIILSISLSKSIHKLVHAVREVSAGNFSVRIRNVGQDEIGELGRAINEMVPTLEENVHLKSSLQLASVVQKSLLPKEAPSPASYDIAGASYYCADTGGDYYDFIACASGSASQLTMAVGDVVGHGIPAALLMATARAYLRSCAKNDFILSEVTRKTNELVVCDTYGSGQFMTLFLASLDTVNNTLTWTRAGHDAAMVYRGSESHFIEFKGIGSTALGVTHESIYAENIEQLFPGDIIVIATDGIWEARSPEGKMFGKELMQTIIRNNLSLSAEKLIEKLHISALDFAKRSSLEDDFTCIVIKFRNNN
jgi:sigma-B regulation protein RsbU (phosphoserine phosphatase)